MIRKAKRTKRTTEKAVGIVALSLAGGWGFRGFLIVIDSISRVQTAARILPYLWIAGTPAGFVGMFVFGIFLLMYATRLEYEREVDEAPIIIRPFTSGFPPQPQHKRKWIMFTVVIVLLSGASALFAYRLISERRSTAQHRPALSVSPSTQDTSQQAAPKKHPDSRGTGPNKAAPAKNAVKTSPAAPSASNPVIDRPAPALPESSAPVTRPPVSFVADIGSHAVRALDKPPGTVYVALKISLVSDSQGTVTDKDVESVRDALESTKKISAFVGSYSLKSAKTYGIGSIGRGAQGAIYYFDPSLGRTCEAVRLIISNVLGNLGNSMRCEPFGFGSQSLQADFVHTAGLDMEVWL
jgi:flagellar basal body-associated protein FliL